MQPSNTLPNHTSQSLQKSMPTQPHQNRPTDNREEQRRNNKGLAKVAFQFSA